MDLELARTFLEIVTAGSFVRAADRLHVTQTTVSARVRLLEQQLGRRLFVRNKAGASLTPAGEQFLRYAPVLLQVWQRARHQVGVPAGRRAVLAVGGELSLWNPLLLRWLIWMKQSAPHIALRAQVGLPESLMQQVTNGVLDIAVMYAPENRPGLKIEMVLEEKLVLVTTDPRPGKAMDRNYVYVDWGLDFASQHAMSFPDFSGPGLFVGLGPMALSYILEAGGSGYFRLRAVQPYLRSGQLHRVRGAPEFTYPTYVVYPAQQQTEWLETALGGMRRVADHEMDAQNAIPKPVRSRRVAARRARSASTRGQASPR